ncbi:MAG TPA: nucleotidyltransferase domain-containing protein, partial [Acinetobacter sp.]|nr:nucleotidyltransferase domain-containing protein [Acinetobacter sp.]
MQDQILQTIQLFKSTLAEDLLAVYLYGSSVDGGLKPQSDVDLLVII